MRKANFFNSHNNHYVFRFVGFTINCSICLPYILARHILGSRCAAKSEARSALSQDREQLRWQCLRWQFLVDRMVSFRPRLFDRRHHFNQL